MPRPPVIRRPTPLPRSKSLAPAPVVAGGNAGPEVLVGLTHEQAAFVIANCDKNVAFGLENLIEYQRSGGLDSSGIERLVELMEQFKGIKAAVEAAIKERRR